MDQKEKAKELVRACCKALSDKKASDISVIDISELSVVADYFIIASADNVRQTEALCDSVEEAAYKAGYKCRQIEGKASADWILMDLGDVIVHIFDKENRLFYDLERIWKDGRRIVDLDEL